MKITSESEHIKVDGHIGTWYVADETVYIGHKFFMLEHEKYGDEAAHIAVDEEGRLVATDLWNGFDDDFEDQAKDFVIKNYMKTSEE